LFLASFSVNPTVPTSGLVKIAVGTSSWSGDCFLFSKRVLIRLNDYQR